MPRIWSFLSSLSVLMVFQHSVGFGCSFGKINKMGAVALRPGKKATNMVKLIRVDDRLLHGQIICAWVPFIKADALVVASDEAAKDSLVSDIIEACGQTCLDVHVKSLEDAVKFVNGGRTQERVILVVGDLKDAMKLYRAGLKFTSLNIGNIHHEDNGRKVTPSVIVNSEDESIIESFEGLGVEIDIRDVPASVPTAYEHRKKPYV